MDPSKSSSNMSIKDMMNKTPMDAHYLTVLCNSLFGFSRDKHSCLCQKRDVECNNSYIFMLNNSSILTFHKKIWTIEEFIQLFWYLSLREAYEMLVELNAIDDYFSFAMKYFKDTIEYRKANKVLF